MCKVLIRREIDGLGKRRAAPAYSRSLSSPLKKRAGRAALCWGLDQGARRGGVSRGYANRSVTKSQAPTQGCPKGCGRFRVGLRCATLAVAACYGSASRALPNSKSPRNAASPLFQRAASRYSCVRRGVPHPLKCRHPINHTIQEEHRPWRLSRQLFTARR